MATEAPVIRLDKDYFDNLEALAFERVLKDLAVKVNRLCARGPIYGQVMLSPEEQMKKKQALDAATQGGQQ